MGIIFIIYFLSISQINLIILILFCFLNPPFLFIYISTFLIKSLNFILSRIIANLPISSPLYLNSNVVTNLTRSLGKAQLK